MCGKKQSMAVYEMESSVLGYHVYDLNYNYKH